MDSERADQLIQRIRERAADPAGRTEERPSEFWTSVTSQSLGGLLGMGRSVVQDLGRLLRQGPDDELTARAEEIARSMTTPAERPLPGRAALSHSTATTRSRSGKNGRTVSSTQPWRVTGCRLQPRQAPDMRTCSSFPLKDTSSRAPPWKCSM